MKFQYPRSGLGVLLPQYDSLVRARKTVSVPSIGSRGIATWKSGKVTPLFSVVSVPSIGSRGIATGCVYLLGTGCLCVSVPSIGSRGIATIGDVGTVRLIPGFSTLDRV